MASPRFPSEVVDQALLGQPLEFAFSGRTAPNRMLNAAMSERMASFDANDVSARGVPSPELIELYRRWGEGGWGQLQTGNVMVDGAHLEAPGNPVIPLAAPFSGPRFEAFQAMASAGKAHGSLMIAQVGHPGRQVPVAVQPNPISASTLQLNSALMGAKYGQPRAATVDDIRHVVDSFAHAAEYLDKAGFDGLELHAAHGYLLAQFLSPRTNQRTDEYGGSLANRARLILEVVAAIRARTRPSFVLGAKINSVEFLENGVRPKDARDLAVLLEQASVDFIELSGGNYEKFGRIMSSPEQRKAEAYYIEYAPVIRGPLTKTKVYVTGGFHTAGAMVSALHNGADGVGIGYGATQEPDLARDMISGKISGMIKFAMDEDAVVLRLKAAVRLMGQMSKGEKDLLDYSDPAVAATMAG